MAIIKNIIIPGIIIYYCMNIMYKEVRLLWGGDNVDIATIEAYIQHSWSSIRAIIRVDLP